MELRERRKLFFMVLELNCMKVNPDKFHLSLSDRDIHICNEQLLSTFSEILLGIKIDKLIFEEHVEGLCKKASQKVNALARIYLS